MALRDDIVQYLNIRNTSAKWCERAKQFLEDSLVALDGSVDPGIVEWMDDAEDLLAFKNPSNIWARKAADLLQDGIDYLPGIPDPIISYPDSPMSGTVDVAFGPFPVTSTGGPVISFSVAPALPAGVTINSSTGNFAGTPIEAQAATDHTVTAVGVNGNGTAVANITIAAA